MARRTYAGASVATTLFGSLTAGATAGSLVSGGGTSLPNTAAGPFVITVNVGGATEEKILVGARTGDNLSSLTRGYDGTTAAAHAAGESVRHTISAVDLDEANGHINDTTLDQHTQYAFVKKGLAALRGAASRSMKLHYGTDTGYLSVDDGSAWHDFQDKTSADAAYPKVSGVVGAAAGTPPAAGASNRLQAGSSVVTLDASGNATITFPTAFSAGVSSIVPINGDGTTQINTTVAVTGCSVTTFTINVRAASTGAVVTGSFRCNWFAVGG